MQILMEVALLFRALLHTLECILTRHCLLKPPSRHTCSIIVCLLSVHINLCTPFFDRRTTQNFQDELINFWCTLFWLHHSDCLERVAGQPENFTIPPNFQSQTKNASLQPIFLIDLHMLTATCLISVFVCVRKCMQVCEWMGG